MRAQIIEKNRQPEWAVIPWNDYRELIAAKEMLDDITAFDAALATSDEENVPHAVVLRLIGGENPLRVWREHRGLSQQALAEQAGISAAYLSQLESGRRKGSTTVLGTLADVLDVTIEDVIADLDDPHSSPRR